MKRVEIENVALPEFEKKVKTMKFDRWYYSRDERKGIVILKA